VGAPRQRPLSGTILDSRTDEVGGLLRCPVCQGLSVADSPATMAQNMKGQVREMLAAGYDEEQVLTYFETSYGEFVRLKPPLRGVNWLVWIAPVAALAAGGVLVARVLRSTRAAAAADRSALPAASPDPQPDRDRLPDDRRLAAYVLRVREQVYGWPGGRSPSSGGPDPSLPDSAPAPAKPSA
jgi:cytochrome c-type biogenesis protein CcmH